MLQTLATVVVAMAALGTTESSVGAPEADPRGGQFEVYWGEQSWDEMYAPQIRATIDGYALSETQGKTE